MRRSDDYIDGLQVAYTIIYKFMQRSNNTIATAAYKQALDAIDYEITKAVDNKPLIITG